MNSEAWRPFLTLWSEEWTGDERLGFPPAAEEQVAAAEARLGCVLPPSFRQFLLTTDGWRHAGRSVRRLRGTADLGWLRDLEPSWISGDSERSLLISREADAGVVFLDPDDVDEQGEWAAYTWFAWTGMGPQRYDSFAALMYELYVEFHALARPECQTQRDWDEKVEQARLASLAGEVDGPLAIFEEAGRFGRHRAWFLLFQMRALLRDYDAAELFEALLHQRAEVAWIFEDPIFANEVLPFLLARHKPTFVKMARREEQPMRGLVAGVQARAKAKAKSRFGEADFDAAVHAALAVPDPDEAWALLREALTLWRPTGDDHLAPIGLLADTRAARLITPERGREILAMHW